MSLKSLKLLEELDLAHTRRRSDENVGQFSQGLAHLDNLRVLVLEGNDLCGNA